MSFENPTALQIGMTGDLAGQQYRVVGRVVMSVTDDGVTYYWNEFSLENDAGENATLVYEETERGGQWRLFTMFEPEYPMTVEDAATKHVGDPLNLNGTDVVVTFVDRSRVQYIQGKGPEGLQLREVSKYFNAEAGDVMQVVSWTDEKLEYYNGINLSSQVIIVAFNLPRQMPPSRFNTDRASALADDDSESNSYFSSFGTNALLALLVVVLGFMGYSCVPRYHVVPVKKILAGAAPLSVGPTGLIDGNKYHLTAHAVVEMAEVGQICQRHEYLLSDDAGKQAVLVCGATPNAKEWTLFTPLSPLIPLTPLQAAAKKIGESVNIDGVVVNLSELFRSTISSVEGETPVDWKPGATFYGFSGKTDFQSLVVRWNSTNIYFYRGKNISSKDTPATFSVQ